MANPIDFNLIQPIIFKIMELAQEKFGEPFYTDITLWNDGTFQVSAVQNQAIADGGSRRVYYRSSLNKFFFNSWKSGDSVEILKN